MKGLWPRSIGAGGEGLRPVVTGTALSGSLGIRPVRAVTVQKDFRPSLSGEFHSIRTEIRSACYRSACPPSPTVVAGATLLSTFPIVTFTPLPDFFFMTYIVIFVGT